MNALKSPNAKRIFCEFFIVAAVCGAAYYFLVDSARAQLAKVREEVAQAQARDAVRLGVGNLSEAKVQDLRRAIAERVANIKACSAPASDESIMFVRMSQLAADHALRVEQINPARSTQQQPQAPVPSPAGAPPAGTPAAQAAADAAAVAPKDSSITYTLVVTGAYSDIAAFLGALPSKLGYTIVRGVRISQPNLVHPAQLRAEITTEHFAFDVSGVKAPPLIATQPVIQPMPVSPAAPGAN
ncbi:MAG TPA: hypothetical protein VHC70_08245 [Phycisphaerales bacterium]|nr:hypothetical protein [Phycisphaerales bacterium]